MGWKGIFSCFSKLHTFCLGGGVVLPKRLEPLENIILACTSKEAYGSVKKTVTSASFYPYIQLYQSARYYSLIPLGDPPARYWKHPRGWFFKGESKLTGTELGMKVIQAAWEAVAAHVGLLHGCF